MLSNRFVWRHLLRYRQDKLDEFINAKKSFRGVFYVKPENRSTKAKKKAAKGRGLRIITTEIDVKKIIEEEEEAVSNSLYSIIFRLTHRLLLPFLGARNGEGQERV